MSGIDVRHEPAQQTYTAALDGAEIGETVYRDEGGDRIFLHTQIDAAHEHHGYAHDLIRAALEDTRSAGLKPVGQCPMVAAYLEEHPEYAR